MKAEVIDALVAAGVSAEQLGAAIKAELGIEEQKKLLRRAKAAERQRRSRARRSAQSQPVTQTERDKCVTGRDAPLDGPLSPDTPFPPLNPPHSELSDESSARPADLRKSVFDQFVPWLAEQTSREAAKVRPVLARWCRDYGDAETLAVLARAARSPPADPVSWIEGELRRGANGRGSYNGAGSRGGERQPSPHETLYAAAARVAAARGH